MIQQRSLPANFGRAFFIFQLKFFCMSIRIILLIGLGGFAGSVLRYWMQGLLQSRFPGAFPVGTFAVNFVGSFLIGILFARLYQGALNESYRALLIVGLCGGFTTFSSFSYEVFAMLREGHFLLALAYVFTSVVLCLAATAGGMFLFEKNG